MDDDTAIPYQAAAPGTPVLTTQAPWRKTLEHLLQVPELDGSTASSSPRRLACVSSMPTSLTEPITRNDIRRPPAMHIAWSWAARAGHQRACRRRAEPDQLPDCHRPHQGSPRPRVTCQRLTTTCRSVRTSTQNRMIWAPWPGRPAHLSDARNRQSARI
jgi:hypothetical protein